MRLRVTGSLVKSRVSTGEHTGRVMTLQSLRRMARLGIEPKPPEYMPGALPLSYLALGGQVGLLIKYGVTDCISNR